MTKNAKKGATTKGAAGAKSASSATTAGAKARHWDVSKVHEWKAAEFPIGAVEIEAGNSKDYITGGWRAERPVWDADTCTSCMLCWVMCPDSSIVVEGGQMLGIDYDHCKGCGICVKECKFGALRMVLESEAKEAE